MQTNFVNFSDSTVDEFEFLLSLVNQLYWTVFYYLRENSIVENRKNRLSLRNQIDREKDNCKIHSIIHFLIIFDGAEQIFYKSPEKSRLRKKSLLSICGKIIVSVLETSRYRRLFK